MLQREAMKSRLVSGSTGKAAQSVEDWLNQFGTARVNVSADENLSLEQIELDVLLPLYDDKTNLFFTQLGTRRADDRNIINTGLGYRHFSDKWMWGANTFYDRQISENHHQRFGFGSELGWDYLKISANGYLRLTEWMASSRYENYDERVANGFDIRMEGYLPSYPQLGASAVFEKYFGNDVDLFNDEDNRQKDPYAVTVGLNYTPFTLITAGISQKMGKGDTQDTQFNLSFSYAPSVSLDKQLDPSEVAIRRSLLGGRQDLVNRNNTIVLDYRKQEAISLGLPDKVEGIENITLPVNAVINSKYGIDRIDWQADDLVRQGGEIKQDKRSGQYSITLPNYQFGGVENHYVVSGKAFDTKGNGSNLSQMNVYVTGADAATWQATTSVSPSSLLADGNSTSTITVKILSSKSQPVTGLAGQLTATIRFTASPPQGAVQTSAPVQDASLSAFKEVSQGVYTSTFTSGNTAGTATITPAANGKTTLPSASIELHSADTTASLNTLTASKTSALANGTDNIQLTVRVLNVEGLPYKGINVLWSADNAKALLSSAQGVSDENGLVTVNVSSPEVINTTVSAQLESGETANSDVLSFGVDMSTALVTRISTDKVQAVADNNDKVTLSAAIVNAQNQPLDGAPVDWKIEQGSGTLSAAQGITDADGNAQVTLTSAMANSVIVSARSGTTGAKNTDSILFAADTSTMNITSLTLDKTQALANGTDAISYVVTVLDANGNRVEDAPVSWSSDSASAVLSATTVSTNAQGQATLLVTSQAAGNVIIFAKLPQGTASQAQAASFTMDASTAQVNSVTADKTQALANGKETVTWTATVKDANQNPVADAQVKWGSDNPNLTLANSITTTNASGMATVTATSMKTADAIVTATLPTTGSNANAGKVSYIADASTTQLSPLTADKTEALASGADFITLSTMVTDVYDNPLANTDIAWNSNPASGTLSAGSTKTDAQGLATVTLSSEVPSNYVVTASANSATATSPSLSFIADSVTAKIATLTADKTTGIVAGVDSVALQATVLDASNHPLSGITVNWSSNNANGIFTATAGVTDSNGVATATLNSTLAQSTVIKASTTNSEKTLSAEFVADNKTAQITLAADKIQATANGTDIVTWKATVLDANNNPVKASNIDWKSDNTLVNLASANNQTGEDGTALMTGTSLKSGAAIITATLTQQQRSARAAAVSYIADIDTAEIVALTNDSSFIKSTGADVVTYSATIQDSNKNLITNATVNWATTAGDLSASTSITNNNGIAVIGLSSYDRGRITVTASIAGASKTNSNVSVIYQTSSSWEISGTTAQVMSDKIVAASSSGFLAVAPTGGPTSLVSSEKGSAPLTVLMKDEAGNQVTVNFGGQRVSSCSTLSFNSTANCGDPLRITPKLTYSADDNPTLRAGVYSGVMHFVATDGGRSSYSYLVDINLTVQ
ncbi:MULTISPECIES: Ig-like domain-containing protein [Rahnella]|uniref:Ig-like domain-containing protein n=2 Tax=Rahnella laticis TaxID=2787622 RepID=A0ABS0E2J6_9GAMM|nr:MULTISPECIES: Ig-like domain-containing protein [Rahnella]MBF7979313.1 Ig-like domain-containing protein [Rahnella laticis]MBF7999422.1 Ig-like domain-containing protein [Rahnella sp. LAC-M12]